MAEPDLVGQERRLRAKRQNERLKLAVSFLNTMALAVVGTAFIIPGVTSLDTVRWSWLPVALILHVTAQAIIGLLKSEE